MKFEVEFYETADGETPPEEIELAMARREDYIKRKREENEKSKTI